MAAGGGDELVKPLVLQGMPVAWAGNRQQRIADERP